MASSRKPGDRDREIGREIARRRKASGLSQAELAERLGISANQQGKYERGQNRITTSRYDEMMQILQTLDPGQDGQAVGRGAGDARDTLRAALREVIDKLDLCLKAVDRL